MFEKKPSTSHMDVATYDHRPVLEPAQREVSRFNNFQTTGQRLEKRWTPGKLYFLEKIMTKIRHLFKSDEEYMPKAQREAKEAALRNGSV